MKTPSYKITIDIRKPETHRALITITSKNDLPSLLSFPVWSPGSYLIREYSRHITKFTGGTKTSKNTWQINPNTKSISYEVYCYERTVRTSFIDNCTISLVGSTLLPILESNFDVHLLLPSKWKTLSTALPFRRQKNGHWIFNVKNDDEWIDCPIVAAKPGYGETLKFLSKNKPHFFTWIGQKPALPIREIIQDLKKITNTTQTMFGGAPFKKYFFLIDFYTRGGGGLEHRNSQLSHFDGYELKDRKKYESFLGLLSHEYFHAWNVKSLRPYNLGPFNYFTENYTEDLWFAEGITSYFDDKIVYESGLISKSTYSTTRLRDINLLKDATPGIRRRSLAEASFDAWIRYYRPDEDSINTDVSYYIKGAQLGFCWDAYLQKKSKGKWTLSKLLRALWKHFGISDHIALSEARSGYSRAELFRFAENQTNISHSIVNAWVTDRKPLPWKDAAKYFRINYGVKINAPIMHFLGMHVTDKEGKISVTNIVSASQAESYGISVNDELIAIENTRVSSSEIAQSLCEHLLLKEKMKKIELLLCRGRQIYRIKIPVRSHLGLGIEYVLKE